ncbi:MAG: S8 family serine peptidase [Candidatus Edwardsbacteria bacterium]|nr:S8 family serine peptidase [Candidatus Edwardsbacteria bacterium]MBU1577358.1 S8 family serine peptidase [Candidatus Edwardsbacteria bacterium]MBU2463202.1 S8 family serine peptidase [Candidatus Edwardsbacteria bacterium]MBU2594173.1 S8 family serine peptidase [Candidatus Edwardsbacteria bacterium]
MKKLIPLLVLLLTTALTSLSLAERPGTTQSQTYLPGTVIIKLKSPPSIDSKSTSTGNAAVDGVLNSSGRQEVKQLFRTKENAKTPLGRSLANICQARVSKQTDILQLCRDLVKTGQVEYAEPRYGYRVEATTPNDPLIGSQWFLDKIQAPAAWDISQGDTTVWIGIVDCGVQLTHPDLADNIWINPIEDINHNGIFDNFPVGSGGDIDSLDNDMNGFVDDVQGWDFCGPDTANLAYAGDNDPNVYGSNNDHGTHVAGDASAVTDNATGVAGIGWNCKVMAIKCSFDNDTRAPGGKGYIYFGYDGIVYAADNGAKSINCSWGGTNYSQFAQDLVNYAWEGGSVVVCAAGNDASSDPHYPSSYNNALSVAATTTSDAKASFSNYGTTVDVSAPGVSIWSTVYPNTYGGTEWSGTSMASPVAAGVVGLIWATNPTWNNTQVATQLIMTTDNIDASNPSYAGLLGTGRINAYKALTITPVPLVKYENHYTPDGGNNIPEAGETVALSVVLKNWWGDAAAVSATIHSDDYAVQILSNSGSYGAVNGGYADTVATFSFTVDNTALPHWATFIIDITADAQNRTDTFYVQIEKSPILLVDDDTGALNVDDFYTNSISKLGYFYDHYDHSQKGAPDTSLLNSYNTVIWLCEWAFPSLDSMDRAALRNYLDNGGNLYLSGQDIGWDLADPTGAQYSAEAEAFYQDYLHATYGGDHSAVTSIVGTTSDPIGDGLAFSILQPYIGANQYYDYFTPRAGADVIMDYSGFSSGQAGIKYSGVHKVVYTGFGFEAITSGAVRDTVMDRIVKWFMGDIQIAHTPLTDTEDTLSPYVVQANVASSAGVAQVYLYWDDDGALPFANRTLMTDMGGSLYEGSIPAHSDNQIDYFVYAANSNGLNKTLPGGAPYNYYSFYAGPDPYAPVITHTPLANTINLSGPYRINAVITDNYGVFQDSSFIHYKVNSGSEYPQVMMASAGNDFSGNISLPSHIYTGDTVHYYITAVDTSSRRNIGRSPASNYHSFVMVDSVMVSNFDTPSMLAMFDTLAGTNPWRTYVTGPHSAPNCMRTGTGVYPNSAEIIMQLKPEYGYNLDAYADNNNWVRLYLWVKGIISTTPGDTIFLEASKDGVAWAILKYRTSLTTSWAMDSVELNPIFSTKGTNDSILFRMRLKSDAASNAFGWLLDDVYLKVQPFPSGVAGTPNEIAIRVFSLDQNRPNPFRGQTAIKYQLPSESRVRINVYNISGQLVRTMVDAKQLPGYYNIAWNGRDNSGRPVSAGVYFYRLNAGDINLTKKMVLLK